MKVSARAEGFTPRVGVGFEVEVGIEIGVDRARPCHAWQGAGRTAVMTLHNGGAGAPLKILKNGHRSHPELFLEF